MVRMDPIIPHIKWLSENNLKLSTVIKSCQWHIALATFSTTIWDLELLVKAMHRKLE